MEKQNETFNKHISRHFLWNYLFYRYVVELKDPSDFTGLEYSISTQIQEGKIEWFPDNGPKDEGGAMEELMGSLKDKMHQIGENLASLVSKQNKDISNNKNLTLVRIENHKKKLQ
jgi:hypothetical protein